MVASAIPALFPPDDGESGKAAVDAAISVQVLKGAICFIAQEEAHTLAANSVATLAASIKHKVEALEESAFPLMITEPKTEKLQERKHSGSRSLGGARRSCLHALTG